METGIQETKSSEGAEGKSVKPKKLPPGNAVQVVYLHESPSASRGARELRLNTQVLRDIVSKTGDHSIAVIVIAGPARRGKSFMLNYIVRYLQALERSGNGDAGDWMEKENPNKALSDNGFIFRNGMDRTTDGIWMWTRPFVINTSKYGSPIAVLVMDTEGCFDAYTNEKEQSSIIGLSLLLSSCFIYNDTGLINESTISTLAQFMQYGQVASQSFDGKAFQRLMFLIRDWTTSGFEHGAAGGQGFIRRCLASNTRMSDQANKNRQLIQDNFEDYNAYLMPFPGKKVVSEDFKGSVGEMKEDFRNHVEKFVSHLIADVSPKTFANEPVLQKMFLKLFFEFVDAFNSDDMPSPNSIISSMVYSAYDSRIRTLSETYQTQFEKRLSSMDDPFLLPAKLEKYHKKLKMCAQKEFGAKKRLGSVEQEQLFQDKLAQTIDMKYKQIAEENLVKQKNFVSVLQDTALCRFTNSVEQNVLISNKIWTESEIEVKLSNEEEVALADFIIAVKCIPDELIKGQMEELRSNLQASKRHYLQLMNQRRSEAQNKISSILETFITSYDTWMNALVTDEDILSQKKLEHSHEKQLNKLSSEFSSVAGKQFTDENFIQQFQAALKNQLQGHFSQVLQANQKKINAVTTLIETDIVEIEEVFKEESEKLLVDASVSSNELLIELHRKVLQVGIKTIEERGLPDAQKVSSYKETVSAILMVVFKQAQDKIFQSLASKQQECDEWVHNAIDNFTQSTHKLVQGQDLLESSELETQIVSQTKVFRASLESTICKIVNDPGLYLNRYDKLVADRKQRIMASNSEKMVKFDRQVQDSLRHLKEAYNQEMKIQEQIWVCLDNLAASHETLSSKMLLRLKSEPPLNSYQNQLLKYEPIFREKILEVYNIFRRKLEVKLEKVHQINSQTVPSWASNFKSEMQDCIHQDPLMTDVGITRRIDQDSAKLRASFCNHMSQALQESALSKEALKKFDEEMAVRKTQLLQEACAARDKANKSIEELMDYCIQFADNHEAFKSMQTNFSTSSTALQETIKSDTRDYFNTLWNIPSTTEEKEKNWEKILIIISTKFQSVFEQLLSKSEKEKDVMRIISDSILHTFCSDVVNFFGNSSAKFYPAETLQALLNHEKTKAISEFQSRLVDKGIKPANKMEEIEAELESKLQGLLEHNIESINIIVAEAKEISANLYESSRKSIKSQADLDKIRDQASEKSWSYIRERCFDQELENHPIIVETFKEYSDEIYLEFLHSLEAETALPEVRNKLIEDAIKMYNATMNKRLEGYEAVNPENLLDFHTFSVRAAQRKIGQTHFIKKELQEIIEDRLKLSYQIFEDKNNIVHAQRNNIAIGIDLGTTTSCVAIFKNGQAQVIKDDSGRSLTPSCVFFDENGSAIVGNEAKSQASFFPESTIFDSKRLIGREFNDPFVQQDIKLWPFQVTADERGKPRIVVRDMEFSPEGISAKILMHMKRLASKQLHKKVTKAVITVPANFSDRQRDATRQAALIAGIEVLQIINEPTAAAMAYALNWKDEEKTVLVFDFGGGTFDVSILRTEGPPEPQTDIENASACGVALPPAELSNGTTSGSRLRVLHTAGDTHLGGEDFDSRMVEFCVTEFFRRHSIQLLEDGNSSNVNTNVRNRRLRRLRTACEEAKGNLTAAATVQVHLDDISPGQDLDVTITRAQFEQMNEDLFQKAIDIVKEALREARIRKQEITEILMVGGSSRIPRVRKLLQDFLGIPSLNINQKVDIQEAVALGAAVQACILNGGSTVGNLPLIKDIQPFSLGITTVTGKMAVIISRNTYIPCTANQSFSTSHDNQKEAKIDIYAGEDFQAAKNVQLGSFTLSGIPPGPARSQTIEVRMEIDLSGILNVTATAASTGRSKNLIIEECRGRYTDEEISEMRNQLSDAVH